MGLDQAYLAHWFSIDSQEATNLTLTPLNDGKPDSRSELRFISDDGQPVNGIVATSAVDDSKKLAMVMHPMGIDQQFWWSDKSPLGAQKITQALLSQGYTVISLDARQHGQRAREGFGPKELLTRAHSDEPRVYIDTIIGTVRDYRIALKWAKATYQPEDILVMGYSMGAQMSLLLAAFEPQVNRVVTMVPPYVNSLTSPVAPRVHGARIHSAEVLWLAGTKDPHSSKEKTQAAFNRIKSDDKSLIWFDSGHRLPPEFVTTVIEFVESPLVGVSQ